AARVARRRGRPVGPAARTSRPPARSPRRPWGRRMSLLPRTRRGVWLTAAAAWLAGCGWLAWVLPPVLRAAWSVPPMTAQALAATDGRTLVFHEYAQVNDRFPGAGHLWYWDTQADRRWSIDVTRYGREWPALSPDG